jgi:hypothetical protein
MSDYTMNEPIDPKKVYTDLMKRCLEAKEFNIRCVVDESFIMNGAMPFDLIIKNGVFTCRVIATNRKEAIKIVRDSMPVIMIMDDEE